MSVKQTATVLLVHGFTFWRQVNGHKTSDQLSIRNEFHFHTDTGHKKKLIPSYCKLITYHLQLHLHELLKNTFRCHHVPYNNCDGIVIIVRK